MALIKDIAHPAGITSQYWRVIYTNIEYGNSFASIGLAGYVSQQARQAGNSPIDARSFTLSPAEFDQYFSVSAQDPKDANTVKNAYNYIKGITGGQFVDAQDDLQLYIN
jgi:hypothetical protein